jgi:hypothetical protein
MNFGQALTFQFKDPEWARKILVISLIMLIPVVGWFFAFGWSLEITRRVIQAEPGDQTLPEIDLAKDMVRGLQGFLIGLVYNLPALAISAFLTVFYIYTYAAFGNGQVNIVLLISFFCLIPIVLAYFLFMTMIVSASFGNFLAQNESLAAGFQISRIFGLVRKAPLAFFLVLVGQFICGFMAFFGLAACVIGVVITSAYTLTVMGHLYGQAFQEAQKV